MLHYLNYHIKGPNNKSPVNCWRSVNLSLLAAVQRALWRITINAGGGILTDSSQIKQLIRPAHTAFLYWKNLVHMHICTGNLVPSFLAMFEHKTQETWILCVLQHIHRNTRHSHRVMRLHAAHGVSFCILFRGWRKPEAQWLCLKPMKTWSHWTPLSPMAPWCTCCETKRHAPKLSSIVFVQRLCPLSENYAAARGDSGSEEADRYQTVEIVGRNGEKWRLGRPVAF